MGEIKVNVEILEEKIQKLRDLKDSFSEIDVTVEEVVGAGESIGVVNAIDEEYTLVKSKILTLIHNSIKFFENLKSSVIDADEASASGIQ